MTEPLPVPALTPRARNILIAVAVAYAAVIIAATFHRSTDLQSHLMLANRMLDGLRVYEPRPQFGTWWPPGALAVLAPLALVARVSVAVAKALFIVAGVSCLVWLVARAPTGRLWVALAALAAVSGPLQKDFENLNLNVVVLTLILASARDMALRRDGRAGVWLGLATAIKIFPVLLVGYAAYRGRWRTAAIGAGLGAALTLAPLLPRGLEFTSATLGDWRALTTAGTQALYGQTHSLVDLIGRSGAPRGVGLVVMAVMVLGAALWLTRRRPFVAEVAMVTHVALLATPIVWAQNFVLLYLTWIALLDHPPPFLRPRGRRAVYAVFGVATSGIFTAVSREVRARLYRLAVYTWAALFTLALLALVPPLGDRKAPSVD